MAVKAWREHIKPTLRDPTPRKTSFIDFRMGHMQSDRSTHWPCLSSTFCSHLSPIISALSGQPLLKKLLTPFKVPTEEERAANPRVVTLTKRLDAASQRLRVLERRCKYAAHKEIAWAGGYWQRNANLLTLSEGIEGG